VRRAARNAADARAYGDDLAGRLVMSGIAPADERVFHLEPLGSLAMRMLDYMVALKFVSLMPGCRISNANLPAWGIHIPAIGSPGMVVRERHEQAIDLRAVAAAMHAGRIRRIDWTGYALRLEHLLPREHYIDVFTPARMQPGYGSEYLVCHLPDDGALDFLAPNQPLTPVEFFEELIRQTGLQPVFIGQTAPDAYTLRLRGQFPNAEFVEIQDDAIGFEIIRQSSNIVVGTSVLAWLAAWLSRADNIFMTVNGLFNPMQCPDVDLLPYGDDRYRFFLFPINYAVPLDQHIGVHQRIAPFWRLLSHDTLKRQFELAPRFERRLDTMVATFDEQYYLASNSDVAEVVKAGVLRDGLDHYIGYGFQERRYPFPLDATWYATQYPMAGFEVAQGDYTDFTHHYVAIGKERGYAPLPGSNSVLSNAVAAQGTDQGIPRTPARRPDSAAVDEFLKEHPIMMADDEVDLIVSNIRNGPRDLLMCEWGSGASTIRWLREMSHGQRLISIEHNKTWYDLVRPVVDSSTDLAARFSYRLCEPSGVVGHEFGHPNEENPVGLDQYFCPDDAIFDADIFFIDGVARGVCALLVLMRARKPNPLIYIHDRYPRQGWYSWSVQLFPKSERAGTTLVRLWKS
jgi:hypothetical protein